MLINTESNVKWFPFLLESRKKNHVAAECCDILSKPGARNTLKASLTGTTFHTNAPAKIIFTIHSGLATVNLQVIIDGNQMLKPSAVQGCWNYSQVSHLIMCLFFGCCFFFFLRKTFMQKSGSAHFIICIEIGFTVRILHYFGTVVGRWKTMLQISPIALGIIKFWKTVLHLEIIIK